MVLAVNYLKFSCNLCYLDKCSAIAEMGHRLATIDMDRKVVACALS